MHSRFLLFLFGAILLTCSTNAAELQVSSDFPGGSAKVLDIDQNNNFIRIMPAGDPVHGFPNWWFFRLDGADTNKPVVLEVVANQATMQTDNSGEMRKFSPNWALPVQATFSTDGTNWEHTPKGKRRGGKAIYQINTTVPTLWLAWGPPFTLKDSNQVIREVCDRSPYAKRFVLARTLGGRPVPGVRIAGPGTTNAPRYGVWINARQHAWESGSSWVARGLLEWLVSDDPDAQSLRSKADITVIPIMDVDSVETGQGGKDQLSHDQNRDWGTTTYFPEVGAAKDRLSAMAKADRLDLYLDLHDPAATDHVVDFYIPPVPLLVPQRIANEDDFLAIVQEQVTGPIPFTGLIKPTVATYHPDVNKSSDTWVPARSPHHMISLTMEIPWNTPGSTPHGYLKVGEQLGRSINLYLQPSIRPESEITTNVPPRFWPTKIFPDGSH
jgi:Zinc carboxypeptidase/Cytosolic carboxypeptidase N-terminal domain